MIPCQLNPCLGKLGVKPRADLAAFFSQQFTGSVGGRLGKNLILGTVGGYFGRRGYFMLCIALNMLSRLFRWNSSLNSFLSLISCYPIAAFNFNIVNIIYSVKLSLIINRSNTKVTIVGCKCGQAPQGTMPRHPATAGRLAVPKKQHQNI